MPTVFRSAKDDSGNTLFGAAALSSMFGLPVVTMQPVDFSLVGGVVNSATLTVAATGIPTPTVQWQKDTQGNGVYVNLAGETSTSLTVRGIDLTPSNNGDRYRAMFTNSAGMVATRGAILTVLTSAGPVIIEHPVQEFSLPLNTQMQKTLVARATSPAPITIQWQKDIQGNGNFTDIPGANSNLFIVQSSDITAANNGDLYRAVFTDAVGSLTSNSARLNLQEDVELVNTIELIGSVG